MSGLDASSVPCVPKALRRIELPHGDSMTFPSAGTAALGTWKAIFVVKSPGILVALATFAFTS